MATKGTKTQKERNDETRPRHFVENCLILELKACKALTSEHVAQVLGYLPASGQRDAMLINFGSSRLEIKKFVL